MNAASTAAHGTEPGAVLSLRALNRATLARQLLLRRWDLPMLETIERLGGFQAQTTTTWYHGLWTRLEGFQPERLAGLLAERQVVRIALMRSTIHLVTARDCLAWRPLLQPAIERSMRGNFRDEQGRELFDLPDALHPQPDTPTPPRFLYDYDNLLLSHADRSRFITDPYFRQGFAMDGPMPCIVLVDGFTNGTWKVTRHRGAATLTILPFTPLSAADVAALTQEDTRLLTFAAAGARSHHIQFLAPKGTPT